MKILKDQILKNGKRRVTVEIEPGAKLAAIRESDFVKLGYPHDDIVAAHVITEMQRVVWCSASQGWEPAE